jgi:phosphoribosylformylglycinamidine synthase
MQLSATDEAAARKEVAEMCEALLANTVIEDYEIEIIS